MHQHWTKFSPVFFNRVSKSSTPYRFDAPNDEYGVLYGSPEIDACLAETLFRCRFQSGPMALDEWEIDEQSVSWLRTEGASLVKLVDLTQPLFAIGGSIEIAAASGYSGPNALSKAFYELPQGYDGIFYPSRYSNRPCVALFDRGIVEITHTEPLKSQPELASILDTYNIEIL